MLFLNELSLLTLIVEEPLPLHVLLVFQFQIRHQIEDKYRNFRVVRRPLCHKNRMRKGARLTYNRIIRLVTGIIRYFKKKKIEIATHADAQFASVNNHG